MSLTNVKAEFLEHTKNLEVKCALLNLDKDYFEDVFQKTFKLSLGYSQKEFDNFILSLNFMYDSGYGGQELFGTIWYKDGSWSDRAEYDGSEWWEHQTCPEIPAELL
jgi:hypothetical protein